MRNFEKNRAERWKRDRKRREIVHRRTEEAIARAYYEGRWGYVVERPCQLVFPIIIYIN